MLSRTFPSTNAGMKDLFPTVDPKTAGFLPVESGVTPLESTLSNDQEATTPFELLVQGRIAEGTLPRFEVSKGAGERVVVLVLLELIM